MTGGDSGPVRPGDELDWPGIEHHLRFQLDGLGEGMEVEQFAHGAANLTYLLRFGARSLVLRRPPFGVLARGAHDMRREFRVLSRLWRVYDRAPRAFLFCDDPAIAGADFFIMEHRTGVVVRGAIPIEMRSIPAVGRRIGRAFVDAAAELHLVDPARCGLEALGRPDGFLIRQLDGWRGRWGAAADEGSTPLMAEVGARLTATAPETKRTAIVHNDLHLGNAQFDGERPDRVTSLFDWDMATLGDPLVDLGGLLAYWCDDAPPRSAYAVPKASLGLPTKDDVVGIYADATGFGVDDVDWYHAFARWKVAIIHQQLDARHRRGESNDPRLRSASEDVERLAEEARQLLEG